jgi:hypothetical protein
LADVAQALANVSQSYSYSAVSGHHAFTGGGSFTDAADFCDAGPHGIDCETNSKCVLICGSTVIGGAPAFETGAAQP